MEMSLEGRLEALGLAPNEAIVYLSALKLGETTIGDLQRNSGLHKQLVYNATESLQKADLLVISEVRGRKHFLAADPSLLEKRITDRLEAVRGLLPALYQVASTKKEKDIVRSYQGLRAVQQYYQESVRTQPEHASELVTGVDGQRFFELWKQDNPYFQRYEKMRNEKNISLKLLFFVAGNEDMLNLIEAKDRKNVEIRIIKDTTLAPIDIIVWTNHVGLMIYGSEPYLIDLAGEHVVKTFEKFFEILWNTAKPL